MFRSIDDLDHYLILKFLGVVIVRGQSLKEGNTHLKVNEINHELCFKELSAIVYAFTNSGIISIKYRIFIWPKKIPKEQ